MNFYKNVSLHTSTEDTRLQLSWFHKTIALHVHPTHVVSIIRVTLHTHKKRQVEKKW